MKRKTSRSDKVIVAFIALMVALLLLLGGLWFVAAARIEGSWPPWRLFTLLSEPLPESQPGPTPATSAQRRSSSRERCCPNPATNQRGDRHRAN
jgi:hypothetical protein